MKQGGGRAPYANPYLSKYQPVMNNNCFWAIPGLYSASVSNLEILKNYRFAMIIFEGNSCPSAALNKKFPGF